VDNYGVKAAQTDVELADAASQGSQEANEEASQEANEEASQEAKPTEYPLSEIDSDDIEFNDFREGWASSWGIGPFQCASTEPFHPQSAKYYEPGTVLCFNTDQDQYGVVLHDGNFFLPSGTVMKLLDWILVAKALGNGVAVLHDTAKKPESSSKEKTDDQPKMTVYKFDTKGCFSCGFDVSGAWCCKCGTKPCYIPLLPRTPTATDLCSHMTCSYVNEMNPNDPIKTSLLEGIAQKKEA